MYIRKMEDKMWNRYKTKMSNNILLSKRRQHKRVYTEKNRQNLQIQKLKNWLSRTGWEQRQQAKKRYKGKGKVNFQDS